MDVDTLYVAGPMRGHDFFNFPAFLNAARRLREVGFEVICPAERDIADGFDPIERNMTGKEDLAAEGFDLREALGWDMQQIAERADGIALLGGWSTSRGATAEVALADALGIPVLGTDAWIARRKRGAA